MARILSWTLSLFAMLALVFITAVGVVLSVETRAAKDALTGWASRQIGRSLAIDGALRIEPGRTLRLVAQDLRLANVSWGARADMLRAGRLLVEIDAWSLVDQPVIVRRIEVDGLDLLLERDAEGQDNWSFGSLDEPDDFIWIEQLPVVVQEVSMPGARLQFSGPRLDRALDLRFDTLEQRPGANGLLALSASGLANDLEFGLTASAGPFDALVRGRDFRVAVSGNAGELRFDGSARVDDLANPVDSVLDLRVQAPEAEYLASRLGVRNLGKGPVSVAGAVTPAVDGRGVRGTLIGTVGAFEIEARGQLAEPASMAKIAGSVDVAGPDLSLLGGLLGLEDLPPETFRLRAAVERSGEELTIDQFDLDLSDSNFRLAGSVSKLSQMTGNELEFEFKGSDVVRFRKLLGIPGVATGPFEFSGRAFRSTNGAETVDLQAKTGMGQIKVSGPLGAYPDYYGTKLVFDASGTDLARLGTAAGVRGLPASAFTARGQFEWKRNGARLANSVLVVGAERLTLDGLIGRVPRGRDTDVKFAANGRDFRRLATVLGIDDAPAGAYDLKGRLRRQPGASRLDNLRGTIAGATLRLNGRIGDDPLRGGTDVEFGISGPALQDFAGLVPGFELPAGRFSADGGLKLSATQAVLRRLRLAAAGAEARLDADISLPLSQAAGTFDVEARGTDLSPFLPTLGQAAPLARSFQLKANGKARNGRWSFRQMSLTTEAGRLSLMGELDWAPDFSATNLQLDLDVADLPAAGRMLGLKFPAQPLKLTAAFSGTTTAFEMRELTGQLGPSDFSGRLKLVVQDKPEFDAEIRSRLLDLTAQGSDDVPAAAAAQPSSGGRRLISDAPLPLGWLGKANGTLNLSAASARLADLALDGVQLRARLRDGRLSLDPLAFQGPRGGQVKVRGELVPVPDGTGVVLSAVGREVVLSHWSDTSEQSAARPKADIDLQFAAQGRTWRELATSLQGRLRVVGGAGVVPATGLDKLLGSLWTSLVSTVRGGGDTAATMSLRCLALVASANGGVLVTAPVLAFQTDKVNVISHGTIDLRDETVNFLLRTTQRKRLGISAGDIINPYVKITGPLSNPGLGVDAKGALFNAGAAYATAGLSIVAQALWDRVFRSDDPCDAALKEADGLAAKSPTKWPSWLPNPFLR
jgi:uncharacterized protein involved in outer membrane biogenesis